MTTPAYMIIETEVQDEALYGEYMEKVPATVEQYGGRYLVRSSNVTPLTGGWSPQRLIIIEFPSADKMAEWNRSPEYQAIAPLREGGALTRAVAVAGVSHG